jgi:hypothetical protein
MISKILLLGGRFDAHRSRPRTLAVCAALALLVAAGLFSCTAGRAPEPRESIARAASAIAGIEGTFEYAIDAPWRIEPARGADGKYDYGAIPINIAVHDALHVNDDMLWPANAHWPTGTGSDADAPVVVGFGNFCDLRVIEMTPSGSKYTKEYRLDDLEEIERTLGDWPFPEPAVGMPPQGTSSKHAVCKHWRGESCLALRTVAGTSEWHASVWYTPTTASRVAGRTIPLTFEATFTRRVEDACGSTTAPKVTLRNHARVRLGDDPLPRFGDDWLYGDLHYHSQGTDNEGESGYNYRSVVRAMGAMGLDFTFATDHASFSEQVVDADLKDLRVVGDVMRDMSPQRFRFAHELVTGPGGVNDEAAWQANGGPSQVARRPAPPPQLFLGGEVDAIPELDSNATYSLDYGYQLHFDATDLCAGWVPFATGQKDCPTQNLFEGPMSDGAFLVKDVQGLNEFEYGREHLVYFPKNGRNPFAFVASETGKYGGGGRRLDAQHGHHGPLLPEIEQKGVAFVAHPLNDGKPDQGPDAVPWGTFMLEKAWRSPAVLGLEFWNEDDRISVAAQAKGYERDDEVLGKRIPTNMQREGWKTSLFELTGFGADSGPLTGRPMVTRLRHGAYTWDRMNHWGLDPSKTRNLVWLAPGEPRRMLMAGGSDAHGDFNARREGYFLGDTTVTDDALGKPRNLVNVGAPRPDAAPVVCAAGAPAQPAAPVYSHEQVVEALRAGEFAITDGPALRIALDEDNDEAIEPTDTVMGHVASLHGRNHVPITVEWESTEEFGKVLEVQLVVGARTSRQIGDGRTYAPENQGPRYAGEGVVSVQSSYTSQGRTYRFLSDGYWADPTGGTLTVVPTGTGMKGTKTVWLDLTAFEAQNGIAGDRFFVRAFAKTAPPVSPCTPYVKKDGKCSSRYAFTNPVWLIGGQSMATNDVPPPSTCPADARPELVLLGRSPGKIAVQIDTPPNCRSQTSGWSVETVVGEITRGVGGDLPYEIHDLDVANGGTRCFTARARIAGSDRTRELCVDNLAADATAGTIADETLHVEADPNGRLYRMTRVTGAIESYDDVRRTWSVISTIPASSMFLAGDDVYEVTCSGELYRYKGQKRWEWIGGKADTYVGTRDGQIFGLARMRNAIVRWAGPERGWERIGDIASHVFAGNSTVYAVDAAMKTLFRWKSGTTWEALGQLPGSTPNEKVAARVLVEDTLGRLYASSWARDSVYRYVPSTRTWDRIGDAAASLAPGFDTVYTRSTAGGAIKRYRGRRNEWDTVFEGANDSAGIYRDFVEHRGAFVSVQSETFALVRAALPPIPDATQRAFDAALYLRTDDGHYLTALSGGDDAVSATWGRRDPWTRWMITNLSRIDGTFLSGDLVAFRAANGRYACAEGAGGTVINANRSGRSDWETFTIVRIGGAGPIVPGDKIALKAFHGQYVSALGGGGDKVVVDRAAALTWEQFVWEASE